jgi:SAM-dependent methyltransferase
VSGEESAIAESVERFYGQHPYPPPFDDIEAYGRSWDDARRRADAHLFAPAEAYRADRSILVAGCGTSQAAHYAVRWPEARVVGIDVSEASVAFTRELKRKHALVNLTVHRLAVERAEELGETFDHVVCTGVLHHLWDPDAGLRALARVLAPTGSLHAMVYAPYGRAGVYILQDYCRRAGVGWSEAEVRDLATTLRALPEDHPIVRLLRTSPDFASVASLADALLHPCDRAYSVPQVLDFIAGTGLAFGRWVRQAPYLPSCGAIATAPHGERLRALAPADQFAAMELFRGTIARHAIVAYHGDAAAQHVVDFAGDRWPDYVPIGLHGTVVVREKLPPGAAAVLINRNHSFTDLYLPLDEREERLFAAVDGERTIRAIASAHGDDYAARDLFARLYDWDQVVFDTSR